jgi:hypothetical protein
MTDPQTAVDRRRFLQGGLAVAAGAMLTGPFSVFSARAAAASTTGAPRKPPAWATARSTRPGTRRPGSSC